MIRTRVLGLLIVLVLLTSGLAGWYAMGMRAAAAADPAPAPTVPVTTAPAQIRDMPVYLTGLGTVQPLNVVQIRAQVNGPLIALPAKEGTEVKQGDIVAEIDPRPYRAALDQAIAQRDEDEAQLKAAQLDLRRYQNLAKSSFAPVQQVEDQQGTVDKEIGAIGVDDALIETAKINLGYCVIRAPVDGRVGFYQLTLGNLLTAGGQTAILSITQNKPISVIFTLPEADLSAVQAARQNGAVPVTVFDGSSAKQLSAGTLMTPNNTIDTSTGTISLRANFGNQDDHLWPGQFVNTRVQVGLLRSVVTIPNLALEHGPDGTFVYTVAADGTAQQLDVQVGEQAEGRVVITKGLSGHETVVVSGQSRLAPGLHVNSTDVSKATPPGGASPT